MVFIGAFPNSIVSLLPERFLKLQNCLRFFFSTPSPNFSSKLQQKPRKVSMFTNSIAQEEYVATSKDNFHASIPQPRDSFHSGLEDVVTGYIFGKKKATEVAHLIWKNVVRKGDVVVDATCGNGFDTLALLKLIGDRTHRGRVYAMDLQKNALENTSSLLDQSVSPDERDLVELYALCHTKMEEIVPQGVSVRLVAFNLGYLPGGDKRIKTQSETTLLALEAAEKILAPGGLISLVIYVGHSGGREELDAVQSFASRLPANNWTCCNLQMLNRPSAPVLVLLSKR
ncbi:tRNA (mnm(5)s(2)U34)-methyltransferase, chloroplastic [Primulina tabacum]|uniref:tRNA (mnm(5)s(2)U34)-methyltransferase, chloroplastic n=1 Tax=Primulina tabacum TaxID=48773 RepID=UPI003F599D5D